MQIPQLTPRNLGALMAILAFIVALTPSPHDDKALSSLNRALRMLYLSTNATVSIDEV
jgi:hypothetical protein